jgi:hypothetical protein
MNDTLALGQSALLAMSIHSLDLHPSRQVDLTIDTRLR